MPLSRRVAPPRSPATALALALALVLAACQAATPTRPPAPTTSAFDAGRTALGFFPSPPKVTTESVFQVFRDIGRHGDIVLIQQNDPWADFATAVDGTSQARTDIANQVLLAQQNGLDPVFVLDALNGLNRREFSGLPAGWTPAFADQRVRTAYLNFALWVVRTFHPRYLGLASEINTYMDAHPADAPAFVSLYREIRARVKAEAPATRVFVTFQWDDLNNLFPQPEEGNRQRLSPNWDQVEAFEPDLDVWAISSYPYFAFPGAAAIPADYYARLAARTTKPLAIAEGGFSSRPVGQAPGTPEDQVAYLRAVRAQLGSRLAFWVNTLMDDIDIDGYAAEMARLGRNPADAQGLANFAHIGLANADGSAKPALATWDGFRAP